MQKLFQNKVTIILLIIALVVLLAACNQNQGASEQAGEQIKDASEWKKQEITRDGGESWEQIEMPDEKAEVKKIEVTDELITMTVEKDAEIWVMKSSDLGESWSTVQSLQ